MAEKSIATLVAQLAAALTLSKGATYEVGLARYP